MSRLNAGHKCAYIYIISHEETSKVHHELKHWHWEKWTETRRNGKLSKRSETDCTIPLKLDGDFM